MRDILLDLDMSDMSVWIHGHTDTHIHERQAHRVVFLSIFFQPLSDVALCYSVILDDSRFQLEKDCRELRRGMMF